MRILIIDDDPERARALRDGLRHPGYEIVGEVGPKDDLRHEIKRCGADVILVSISSPDRDIIEHFRQSSSENPKPIVMFVDQPGARMTVEAIDAGVSAYIIDGLAAKRVKPVLEVAIARFREFQRLKQELKQSQDALADRKIIDRAKGLLMDRQGMSETDAYASLRRAAMSQGQRIVDVARSLLAVANLLKP